MRSNRNVKMILQFVIVIALIVLLASISIYFLVPYNIEKWQIDLNSDNWQISVDTSEKIQNLNVSKFYNTSRYQSLLIKDAVQRGIPQQEMTRAMSISVKQGPKKKIPVFIKTAYKDKIPVIIVIYRIQPFWSWSKDFGQQWFVVMRKDNGAVIMSDGTL